MSTRPARQSLSLFRSGVGLRLLFAAAFGVAAFLLVAWAERVTLPPPPPAAAAPAR